MFTSMFSLKLIALGAFVFFKLATAISNTTDFSVEEDFSSSSRLSGTIIDQASTDEAVIHANILQSFPADKIVTSDKLLDYVYSHPNETDTLLYLSDIQGFASTANIPVSASGNISNGEIHNRETIPCRDWTYYKVVSTAQFWDPWLPISSCAWNGNSDQEAERKIAWSFTKSIEFNFGLTGAESIKNILSASLGISVSTSVSQSEEITCKIGAGSVGQIWARSQVGFAGLKRVDVWCNDHQEQQGDYWAVAPIDAWGVAQHEQGCSTGQDYVWCEQNYGNPGHWN